MAEEKFGEALPGVVAGQEGEELGVLLGSGVHWDQEGEPLCFWPDTEVWPVESVISSSSMLYWLLAANPALMAAADPLSWRTCSKD